MAEFYLTSQSAFPHRAGLFLFKSSTPLFLSSPFLQIWHYSNSHIDAELLLRLAVLGAICFPSFEQIGVMLAVSHAGWVDVYTGCGG